MPACDICDREADLVNLRGWERVYLDDSWRLTLAFDSSLPGWLVLVPRRHVEGLHELTASEATAMGSLLRAASTALVEVTGCERTYVMLFAESTGFRHLHVHVVPRHADLPSDRQGPAIFGYLGATDSDRVGDADLTGLADRLRSALRRGSR